MYGIIYVISNSVNPMQYVGQAKNLKHRWRKHRYMIKTRYNHPFYNAMRKYGIDKFFIVQIDAADFREELNDEETFHVHRLNTLWPNGYNLAAPGGREEMSDEVYRHICEVNANLPKRIKVQECVHGHPLDEVNTYFASDGSRHCRVCVYLHHGDRVPEALQKYVTDRVTTVNAGEERNRIECPRGHPYDEVNTYVNPSTGKRACRTCHYLYCSNKLPAELQKYVIDQVTIATTPNKGKKECIHGHRFDAINTYIQPSTGYRQCLTCCYLHHRCKLPEKFRVYVTEDDYKNFDVRFQEQKSNGKEGRSDEHSYKGRAVCADTHGAEQSSADEGSAGR